MVDVGARPEVGRAALRRGPVQRRPVRWWPWVRDGGWGYLVVFFSAGTLAAVPFWHAAVLLRRRWLIWSAAAYTAADIALVAVISATPRDAAGFPVGRTAELLAMAYSAGCLLLTAVACVQLHWVRRAVWGAPPPRVDDVLRSRVSAARARREDARVLLARDPELARELGVGRPDLGRGYDDGGLVDVNGAPAPVLEQVVGLTRAQAEAVVAAREARGVFSAVDEVLLDVPLPPEAAAALRERAIVQG